MATNLIRLDQYAPLQLAEIALRASVDSKMTPDYATELASTTGMGKERSRKIGNVLRAITVNSTFLPWLQLHGQEVNRLLDRPNDRGVVIAAVYGGAYSLMYNALTIIGKYLHTQDTITSKLVKQQLSTIYGSNLNFDRAISTVMRILLDCGLLTRIKPGVYAKGEIGQISDFTRQLYRQSFLIHNPYLSESDNIETNPYFELIN